ncbi:MAG: right-handed parallel beta-helix repeat-containing protein [Kiritimatiellae bacterium]|nr:right-handed parallel beta-helix repeat-containing protein [Kiritimatiellia bacterium]MDD4735259.1 right-handed parallel beta-helix repeat-containing protein [Kiritimatiellia bacterium]
MSIRRHISLILALMSAFASTPAVGAAYYVATNGSNSASGLSTGTPWRTIGYAVNRVNAGDTVYIRGGEYREFVDCTNTRGRVDAWITVQAYSNEIPVIKGSDIVTGWVQHSSSIWKKTNWTVNSQQVFVDGNLLQQIGWPNDYVSTNAFSCSMGAYVYIPFGHSCTEIDTKKNPFITINGLAEMVPYSFFYDKNAKTLYMRLNTGDDPSTHRVEVSTRYGHFYAWQDTKYIRLSGLGFRHNSSFMVSPYGWPGVMLGNACILEDSDVQWCDAPAVAFHHNAQLLRTHVSNNGMDGARVASATNVVIASCEITYNNYRRVSGNYLAGIKCHPDSSGIVESNEVAWNRSIGVWFDTCKTGNPIIIRNNRIHHNRQQVPCANVLEWSAPGIFVEYSVNADVHDNLIYSNAISGIEISGSSNCRFYNNTIEGTYRPQGFPSYARTYTMFMYVHYSTESNINNRIYNNIFAYNNTDFDLYASPQNSINISGNMIDYNCYYRHSEASASKPSLEKAFDAGLYYPSETFCNALTFNNSFGLASAWSNLSAWSAATGWDSNSIAADPMLIPAGHLATNSPCVDSGVVSTFMNLTVDLDGNPRIMGARIDMGAFELGEFLCDFSQNVWTGLYPLAVTFTGAGVGTNSEVVWYGWDFDGDGAVDVEGADASCVTNVYAAPGNYTVGLYVSNSVGEAASKVKTDAVRAMVQYPPGVFTFRAVALTNSVTLRWASPVSIGVSNALVRVRFGTNDYPASLSDGDLLTTTTNQFYTHTNLVSGTTYFYTIWVSHDGVNFHEP